MAGNTTLGYLTISEAKNGSDPLTALLHADEVFVKTTDTTAAINVTSSCSADVDILFRPSWRLLAQRRVGGASSIGRQVKGRAVHVAHLTNTLAILQGSCDA